MAQAGAQARAQVKAQPMKWSNVINVYKYTWTPSFKGNPSWVQAGMYRMGRGQLRR